MRGLTAFSTGSSDVANALTQLHQHMTWTPPPVLWSSVNEPVC